MVSWYIVHHAVHVQVIRAANAEVCYTLQNPLYNWYLKLPGRPSEGQVKIKQFHGIMSDLMAEVSFLSCTSICCSAVMCQGCL